MNKHSTPVAIGSKQAGRARAFASGSREGGAALIVAMVLLLVLTAMGLSGMRTANMEEHFAGNLRDQNLAFQAAESGSRSAEDWLGQQTTKPQPVASCASPPCDLFEFTALVDGDFADQSISWWKTNGRSYVAPSGSSDLPHLSKQPLFIVEEMSRYKTGESLVIGTGDKNDWTYAYRITTMGSGGSQYSNAVIQATYVKRFYKFQ